MSPHIFLICSNLMRIVKWNKKMSGSEKFNTGTRNDSKCCRSAVFVHNRPLGGSKKTLKTFFPRYIAMLVNFMWSVNTMAGLYLEIKITFSNHVLKKFYATQQSILVYFSKEYIFFFYPFRIIVYFFLVSRYFWKNPTKCQQSHRIGKKR